MQITQEEALDLLQATIDTNQVTGRIGGPFASQGYSAHSALAVAGRCETFERRTWKGQDALLGTIRGIGVHVWYLNLTPPPADPWK